MDFQIDREFKQLVPPLSAEELAELEKSLLQFGCRDPLVLWQNGNSKPRLLDGHHRFKLCRRLGIPFKTVSIHLDTRDEARLFLIDNQAARRNLPKFTMVELQLKKADILERQAKENQRASDGRGKKGSRIEKSVHVDKAIAEAAGTGKEIVFRTRYLLEHAEEYLIDRLRRGELSVNEAFKTTRNEVRRSERQEAHHDGLRDFRQIKVNDEQNVHHGDFREVSRQLDDNSVDLIFCDPEYALDKVHLYGDLARIGARILKPGGALLCYTGNKFLPEVLELMTPHLKFYWTLACIHSGNAAQEQHHRNIGIIGTWKPLLLFVKEKRSDRTVFIRDSIVGEYDKRFHPFGQGLSEAQYFIEKLSLPGQLIVDAYCGAGTTLVAAKELKREWWGCDLDREAVTISRRRLQ